MADLRILLRTPGSTITPLQDGVRNPPRDVIHGLDFTVPLGAGRRAPQQRLRIVLQAMTTPKTLKYFGVDLAGIELRADDFD
jgi:hypothetical protein